MLRRVVDEIAESCNLAVLHKGALIYLDRIEAPWPLRLQLPEGGVALPLVRSAEIDCSASSLPLRSRTIHFVYALRSTLVPIITVVGLQIGTMIAFSVVTETVFQWPGMGLLFIQAVSFADIPIMAAYLFMVALVFVVINLAVDLLYVALDPRLRAGAA